MYRMSQVIHVLVLIRNYGVSFSKRLTKIENDFVQGQGSSCTWSSFNQLPKTIPMTKSNVEISRHLRKKGLIVCKMSRDAHYKSGARI